MTKYVQERTLGKRNREHWAWYLYDFGNSAYAAVVLLAIYSLYFKDTVVGGEKALRFSPPYPNNIPDFSSPQLILENSQRELYVLNTNNKIFRLSESGLGQQLDKAQEFSEGDISWVDSLGLRQVNIQNAALNSPLDYLDKYYGNI